MNKQTKDFVFGIQAVREALQSDRDIEKLLIRKDNTNEVIKQIQNQAYKQNIPIQKVPVEKLNNYTKKNNQGIIAILSAVTYASLDHIIYHNFQSGNDPLLTILDRVTDVRNFGSIARTAEGLGFHGIIIPARGAALVNEEAMKTSAGALVHIPVCRVKNLRGTVDYLKKNGIRVMGCIKQASISIFDQQLTGPLALVLGSEYDGISSEIQNECDQLVSIPMFGKINSYNVSVTMAMAGIEIIRQRSCSH